MRAACLLRLGIIGLTLTLALAACGPEPVGRPPIVNSGSYNWRDAYRGPNGYPLPGWGGYFAPRN